MPDQSTDYRIVVLGSAGVGMYIIKICILFKNILNKGKTNCVLRFVNGQFRENYIPTVEDTYRQVVSCNKQITTLQITDTYDKIIFFFFK
jgi:GTPase SAR1 family protein